jgi:uncharacterized membrane protein YhaH (DUF805 family)
MDLKDWFSFEGSLSKAEFGKRALICILPALLLYRLPGLGYLIGLVLLVALIAACIRRLTSIGKSPIFTLLLIVPVVGLVFVIWLALQD